MPAFPISGHAELAGWVRYEGSEAAAILCPDRTEVDRVNGWLQDRSSKDAAAYQLSAIVESSQDAIIAWSLEGVVTSWNRGAERLLGFAAAEALGMRVRDLYGPEERSAFPEMVRRLAAGEQIARYEGIRVRKDRTFVEVSATLSPIKNTTGEVIGASSVFTDIGEYKRAREMLIEERNRWQGAFENAPIGMALVSLEGRWLEVNRALCKLLVRERVELLATDVQTLSHPDDLDSDLAELERVLAGEIDGYEIEKRYLRPDGEVVWAMLSVSLVRDVNNEPAYFVSQLQDITARKQADAELARYAAELDQLARRDPLTGLRNHRGFHALLDHELARARRHDQSWSVVLIRMDDLAHHIRRDPVHAEQLICQAAETISHTARTSDLAARIAHDEFALILPGADAQRANDVVERIMAAVDRAPIGSLSYGVATWPDDGSSKELLLSSCDMQLKGATQPPDSSLGLQTGRGQERAVDGRIREIVSLARAHFGMDVAYFAEAEEARQTFASVEGDVSSFNKIEEGASLSWDEAICRLMLDRTIPNAVPAVADYARLRSLALVEKADVGSYIGVPVTSTNGQVYGTLCGLSHQPTPDLGDEQVHVMRFLAGLVAGELERQAAHASQHRAEVELAGIHALLSALEARDHYTGEHSKTVVSLAVQVARAMGLDEERTREVEHVALLHDIGKVGIPDSILQKQGPLTDDEWVLMREHPSIGARVVAATRSLAHFAAAVNAEHERYDGTGYPDRLARDAIPLASRIAFACDAYHAMTSHRPYRAAMETLAAQAELRAGAGTQFDPHVVDALLAVLNHGLSKRTDQPERDPHRDVLTARPPRQILGREHSSLDRPV